MHTRKRSLAAAIVAALAAAPMAAAAAYDHQGEQDARNFTASYPDKAGTKLDSCTLCHKGGSETVGTKTTVYGSCQWCHLKYAFTQQPDIALTLNPYGQAYLGAGRNAAAITAIEALDSDGDGYGNIAEIRALRFPGDANDDPSKVTAPYVVFSKAQLQAMPQHSQFLLMNTTKSGDYYAEYSGVVMQDLLKRARMTSAASKVTAFAPDGFSQGHPLEDSAENTGRAYMPYVNGTYPAATFYYDPIADKANTGGWCDYGSQSAAGRKSGDPIDVAGGLRLLLALQAEGKDLVPGALDPTGTKLTKESEGPFRVIPPQKVVGPPDQPSTASGPNLLWPYDSNADHNAGFATKCTTILRAEPLPANTTDIDLVEAGWSYIDQQKIVIYGALEQLRLVHPADGGRTPFRQATLVWARHRDPDPAAKVSYVLQYTTGDPVKGPWTSVEVAAARTPRLDDGAAFLAALLGEAMLPACPGGWDDLLPGRGWKGVVSETVKGLERRTRYYWRVTADGPSSHNVSQVRSFTTGG